MKELMLRSPVIPVMVINNLEDAVPLARSLVDGGLDVLEITLRTDVAIEAIKLIKKAIPEAIVGTGTVMNKASYQASKDVGADFMVSPGTSKELLHLAMKDNANLLPGVATPSEAMQLLELGYDCQKFFPAEAAGGINMLKSILGPLPQITFCPTGGINMNNAKDYLLLPNVACVGGSWMLDKNLIEQNNWQEISQITSEICRQLTKNTEKVK